MRMSEEELDKLLNQPIYLWDVRMLLAGIVDFLEVSERNLVQQREVALREAEQEAAELDLGEEHEHLIAQAQDQIVEGAKMRFDLGLSQSVRRAGLVAFVSTMEWCALLLKKRMKVPCPETPKRTNESVFVLSYLNGLVGGQFATEVEEFSHLVKVRNCVIHAVGLVDHYQYKAELPIAIGALAGVSLNDGGFMGEAVHIDADAIEAVARRAQDWVWELDRLCAKAGVLR